MKSQTKWFDRSFDFSFPESEFSGIVGRLERTPGLLEAAVADLKPEQAAYRYDGKWSVKENIGHLIDLEALWQNRLTDLLAGEPELRPADLSNSAVERGNFNVVDLSVLLADFRAARAETLRRIALLSAADLSRSALHPRLQTPMRVVDHFLFVAEHDEHHLGRVGEIVAGI